MIRVVLDNLNAHTRGRCTPPSPLLRRRGWPGSWTFTSRPSNGSWLNVAECELAVLATQCLDRRLPDLVTVAREAAAWETRLNRERPTVKWHFTTAQARRKLNHLYPHPA